MLWDRLHVNQNSISAASSLHRPHRAPGLTAVLMGPALLRAHLGQPVNAGSSSLEMAVERQGGGGLLGQAAYIIPMPPRPAPAAAGASFFSGLSATVASVVKSNPATDAAF